jgi:hypothetical protein
MPLSVTQVGPTCHWDINAYTWLLKIAMASEELPLKTSLEAPPLLELQTDHHFSRNPMPSPSWFRAARALPSGQGVPPKPPSAAPPLSWAGEPPEYHQHHHPIAEQGPRRCPPFMPPPQPREVPCKDPRCCHSILSRTSSRTLHRSPPWRATEITTHGAIVGVHPAPLPVVGCPQSSMDRSTLWNRSWGYPFATLISIVHPKIDAPQ